MLFCHSALQLQKCGISDNNYGFGILLAVSGGLDSMCMLDMFARGNLLAVFPNFINVNNDGTASGFVEKPRAKGSDLYVAYVNHGVRADAHEDENLIKRKCEEYGIPFYALSINPEIFRKAQHARGRGDAMRCGNCGTKGGFEAVARDARYNLLFELKKKLEKESEFALPSNAQSLFCAATEKYKLNDAGSCGCGKIYLATAHHSDDQAETVFLRIARGTGLKGLRGILAERKDGVIRPMLNFSKEDLLAYAKKNGVEWREDSTNKSVDYFRNKVRLHIFPKLEAQQNGAVKSLTHIAELSQKLYPKILKILNAYFAPFLESSLRWVKAPMPRTKRAVLLSHFYLPAMSGYGELFRLWLDSRGICWEETGEDNKFYQKLQKKESFRFRLGKAYFERKRELLWCAMR